MKHVYLIWMLLVIPLATQAQSYTVETVPNTKLVNNSYVSDPSRILNDSTVARINQLLGNLEKTATAQVAVVMLPSIGNENLFDFAQRLFVYWGIGRAGKDNGLLILFVMDQRNIRFHTGKGLEGVLPDVTCKRIQQRFMVPYFKEGDYNTGMLNGINATVSILSKPEAIEEIFARDSSQDHYAYLALAGLYAVVAMVFFLIVTLNGKFKPSPDYPKVTITRLYWLLLYLVLPLLLLFTAYNLKWSLGLFMVVLYSLIVFWFAERFVRVSSIGKKFVNHGQQQDAYNFMNKQKWYWLLAAIFFPIPMILVYQLLRRKRNSFRNHPRLCRKCGTQTVKLSEAQEDEFLKDGQITEEKIGTIDYDVWKCNTCGSVETLRYPNKKSKFTHCPKCGFMTYHFGARRTIESASYTSDGYGEEERTCMHCGHHHLDKFIIPMLVVSSSSGSDSSSSSSSDSGGSWGGGDSGGGGASSSW
ncbi:MAG: TPM domain-containing protein [Cyclobacteriaceae bacterium]|nr:TPM domain-containing protein [Cyclobacteriaceae bacterium]UYN86548.1 MAG: TPM domain-containing protein [Cyclobacteriaceae bacterium]